MTNGALPSAADVAFRAVVALPVADQLRLLGRLATELAEHTPEGPPDSALVVAEKRRIAHDCLVQAVAHIKERRLAQAGANADDDDPEDRVPTSRQYDQIALDIGLPMTASQITQAWVKWNHATDVVRGYTTLTSRAMTEAQVGRGSGDNSLDDCIGFVQLWLATNPRTLPGRVMPLGLV